MTAITKSSDRFTEADIDHEIVIMRLDTGDFYSLSGTGAAIWRLIDGRRDRDALVAAMIEEFDGDRTTIMLEVDQFLSHLRESRLLVD